MLSKIASRLNYKLSQISDNRKIAILFALTIFTLLIALFIPKLKRQEEKDRLITNEEEGFEKLVIPERERSFFELGTSQSRKYGILPQEEFVLKTLKPVSVEYVTSVLKDSGKFNIEKVSETEFKLTNKSLLGLDEPVTISLETDGKEVGGYKFDRNYNWSFQSQGKFRVVSTIPGNERNNVPLNTGIEIVFSQDGFEDPTRLVEITPSIKFETKILNDTFVIVPQENLVPETVYTVKLKRGLSLNSRNDRINEDYDFSFQTQEKVIPGAAKARISIRDNFVQTSPSEPFITKVDTSNWNSDTKLEVKAYRFADVVQFVNTRQIYEESQKSWMEYYPNQSDFSKDLTEITQEEVNIQEQDRIKYIQLSKTLDPGYYLIEFRLNDTHISHQVWYQSTELTGYISLGKEQIIVWSNNLASKSPSAGTQIKSITTGGTWITDANGVAKFPSSQVYFDENKHFFVLTDQYGNSLVLPVMAQKDNPGPDEGSVSDYWSYLYTEKIYYLSNDTVNAWGVIKDRDSNTAPSASLVLITPKDEEAYSQVLNPLADGSFIAQLPLQDAPAGWYQVILRVGDVDVKQVGFSVREYIKPDMKIEITPNKKAVFAGEEVEFGISTSFFDGTPGANIPLNVHKSNHGDKSELKTDDNGNAKYIFTSDYSPSVNYPLYQGISALPAMTQESIVQGDGSITVYGPKIMITTKRSQNSNKASFTATINKIDLTGINAGTTYDPKGELVSSKDVKIKIVENWTERRKTGEHYNFVEKVTYPRYEYERKNKNVADIVLVTNQSGEISYEFDMTEGRSYEVVLTAADDLDRKVTRKLYYYASRWSIYSGYSNSDNDTQIYMDLAFGRESNIYSAGEDVYIKLTQQGDDYKKEENNKFLFTIAQRGNQDIFIENVPLFSFTFSQNHVPNVFVSAVVFNGRNYKRADGYCRRDWKCDYDYSYYYDYYYDLNTYKGIQIVYDSENSKLDLEIKASKGKYEPGEQAVIDAVVTKDGKPASGISVNLVMIDAALAAIGGARKPSVLSSLYQNVPHQVYFVYTSHEPIVPDIPAAERGGGGGDRDLFKDTAAFFQAQTDSAGLARFTFELPDNITTWLTYIQAVSSNLDAGHTEGSVIVTKDFFVTSKFPKNILEEDQAFVSMNSFGLILKEGDNVDFSVLFKDGASEMGNIESAEKAFTEKSFPIPKLPEGSYDVIVRGQAKGKNDGIRLPISVIESRIKQDFSTKHSLNRGESLSQLVPEKYINDEPVIITVSDKGKGKFFYTLIYYCYSSSNRLEKSISSQRANTSLKDYFDYDKCRANGKDLSIFQGSDGGLAQVKWGGSNLDTSLWATVVFPNEFDREKLISYFNDRFISSQGGRLQKIQSSWALSMLGKSKLKDLQNMAGTSLSFEEKVNLGLALAYLGDTEVARGMFLDILADHAYKKDSYIRIDANQNRGTKAEDFVVDTSKTLLLGELVEKKYNDGMFDYVSDYKYQLEHYLIDLSEISYIEREIEALPQEDTVYTISNSQGMKTDTLNRGKSEVYELTPADVAVFNFLLSSGKAEVFAKYKIGIDELVAKNTDNRLSIKRSYSRASSGDGPIRPGDIIKVTLKLTLDLKEAPRGRYQVVDVLPSGLTYITNPGSFGMRSNIYYSSPVSNGNIAFKTYNSPFVFKGGEKTYTYFTRASAVGKYKAEPAVFQSLEELTVFDRTDSEIITIE